MRANCEVYKGIEFVRISNLPSDQKEKIQSTFPKDKIIKILKDEMVLADCVQYSDYLIWFENYSKERNKKQVPASSVIQHVGSELTLSIK